MSNAMRIVKNVWNNRCEGTEFSWRRLNAAMHSAVMLAIEAGLKFGRDDFKRMSEHFRIEYWGSCWGSHGLGEGFYKAAVEMDHATAYQAFEAWKGRKPFIIDGKRIYYGARFEWYGKHTECTSFARDESHIVCCQYKLEEATDSRKIAARLKITHADIYEYNKTQKAAQAK